MCWSPCASTNPLASSTTAPAAAATSSNSMPTSSTWAIAERIADDGFIVLSATFNLAPGNAAMIKADMDDYRQRREDKQPLDMPSAGSTFKRPRVTLPASSSWMPACEDTPLAARR
ncbi:MAG: hypothetical protein ACLTYW_11405 [Collinsella sp.]